MLSKKILITAVVIVTIGALIVWSRVNQPPVEVSVVAVEMGQVEATVANTRAGTVKACRRSNLSMPSGGVVDGLFVNEGDLVTEGQLLLELWNADRKADLQMAEKSYAVAQNEMEQACVTSEFLAREADRITQMGTRNLISEEAVDRANTEAASQESTCNALKNSLEVASAALDYQQAIIERTQLRAPFDGVVAEINGEIGEYVTPSPPGVATPPAVDLIDYSCLYVTAPIDEVDAGRLQTGMPARVTLDAFRGLALDADITRIAPYVVDLEKQARTVDIDVQLMTRNALPVVNDEGETEEELNLLVGYSADVTVILEFRDQVLRVPTEALLPNDQMWVLAEPDEDGEGRLELRQLKTGISNWTYTQVLEGLSEGDLVVRNPDSDEIVEGIKAIAINLGEARI